ncbi:hypothetical protein ACL9RL_09990 [Plantibacter sp. Mn2098]|uniref:hypothetical protein n=1 Tax=Plantibacter sp. Mn2098 TaxID=3395266 RepID=UPI003BCB6089
MDYEAAWQAFIDVRDGGAATPQSVLDASEALHKRWETLADSGDAPDDVTEMVRRAASSFTSAWISSTSSERNAYEESWTNGRDYIALRCSDIGLDLHFDGDDVPVEIPRLTHE